MLHLRMPTRHGDCVYVDDVLPVACDCGVYYDVRPTAFACSCGYCTCDCATLTCGYARAYNSACVCNVALMPSTNLCSACVTDAHVTCPCQDVWLLLMRVTAGLSQLLPMLFLCVIVCVCGVVPMALVETMAHACDDLLRLWQMHVHVTAVNVEVRLCVASVP